MEMLIMMINTTLKYEKISLKKDMVKLRKAKKKDDLITENFYNGTILMQEHLIKKLEQILEMCNIYKN